MRSTRTSIGGSLIRLSACLGLVCLLALFGPAGAARANDGPHGNYGPVTDACAGCHRTHTGSQAGLLKGTDVATLCLSCHGASGSGANTNVSDGRYTPTGAPLNGGGFVNFKGTQTTSKHTYDGSLNPAWGSDWSWASSAGCLGCHSNLSSYGLWEGIPEWHPGPGIQPGQVQGGGNVQMPLTCTNCHDPHGARSYRLLQNRVHPEVIEYEDPTMSGYVQVVSNESGGLNPDQPGYVANYTAARYRDGISSWCSGCHMLYQQTQSSPSVPFDAADGLGARVRYRHALGVTPSSKSLTTGLPLQQPAGYSSSQQETDKVACVTCHYAHGTNAQVHGYAQNVAPANDSTLLRMDNRGVCEDCHKK